MAARECYVAMLEMDDHLQTKNIGEQWPVVEPVERLEEILLDDSKLDRTTRIGTLGVILLECDYTHYGTLFLRPSAYKARVGGVSPRCRIKQNLED